MKVTTIQIIFSSLDTVHKAKGTGKGVNQMLCRDYQDYSIILIGQNTEKSPGHFKRLADSQTPVEDH